MAQARLADRMIFAFMVKDDKQLREEGREGRTLLKEDVK
jgi:hypothetical protein